MSYPVEPGEDIHRWTASCPVQPTWREDQLLKELQQSEAPRGAAELRSDDASVGEVSGLESG